MHYNLIEYVSKFITLTIYPINLTQNPPYCQNVVGVSYFLIILISLYLRNSLAHLSA